MAWADSLCPKPVNSSSSGGFRVTVEWLNLNGNNLQFRSIVSGLDIVVKKSLLTSSNYDILGLHQHKIQYLFKSLILIRGKS